MSHLDKIWLITDEATLDALDSGINTDLINADIRTYVIITPDGNRIEPTNFTFKRYHPTVKGRVASPFKVGKVPSWDIHILKNMNERNIDVNDLVKLGEDWEIEI